MESAITTPNFRKTASPHSTPMTLRQRLFMLGYGFIVWLLATLSFKWVGLDETIMPINYALLLVGMPLLNWLGYRWQGIQGGDYMQASILFALPGMLLDSVVMNYYPVLFTASSHPLMPEQGHFLGSWLLFGNALTLLTGFVADFRSRKRVIH